MPLIDTSKPVGAVIDALLYLRLTMLRNVALGFLRRLRQPRYLLGLAMALGYFWLLVFRRSGVPPAAAQPADFAAGLHLVMATAMMVALMAMWLFSSAKPGLGFTEAETAFLFPAPLSRRQLLHYKLLSGLGNGLFSAVFFTLFLSLGRSGTDQALRNFAGVWLLTTVLGMHNTVAAFTLSRWQHLGYFVWARRVVLGTLIIGFLWLAAWLAVDGGRRDWLQWLLAPGRLLLLPFFSSGIVFVAAVAALAALLVLHYWWILVLETPFEEDSMAVAARKAELVAQLRAGKGVRLGGKATARRQPFRLRAWMPVELLLLWKNLMLARHYLNRRVFVVMAVLIVAGMHWLHQRPPTGTMMAGILGFMALPLLAYAMLMGTQLARLDLRSDIVQADLLKAWPVPGWRIVLGSMLAPLVILTAIEWLLLLTGVLGVPDQGRFLQGLSPAMRVPLAVSLALLLPVLNLLLLVGPNAVCVYFPAWAQYGAGGQRGFDAMGIRLILMLAQLLLLVLSLVPALVVAGIASYFSQWFFSAGGGLVLATVCGMAVLLLEVLFAVHLMGERFEKLDIAAELRP